jgi:NAD(P)-dependent dehydrogenase (short-subunit alcohol dehydrogenase family)
MLRKSCGKVNFLSTASISVLLIPLLLKCPQRPYLLLISSEAHAWADPRQSSLPALLEQLNEPTAYKSYERYHISKLLIVLWVETLASLLSSKKILVASASPGFCRSGLFRLFNGNSLARCLESLVCRTSDEGASQYLMALKCLDPANHGMFFSDGQFRG